MGDQLKGCHADEMRKLTEICRLRTFSDEGEREVIGIKGDHIEHVSNVR